MTIDPLIANLALEGELPLAHFGHYLWTLYIPPVLIVVFSIIRTMIVQRREDREEQSRKGRQGTEEGPSPP